MVIVFSRINSIILRKDGGQIGGTEEDENKIYGNILQRGNEKI